MCLSPPGLAGADSDACGVGELGAGLFFEVAGLEAGGPGEFLLDRVDLGSDRGGLQCCFACGELGLLGGVEDAGGEESLVR